MKRIYYGSVTCEVAVPVCETMYAHTATALYNIACLTWAESEDEAKGWAVAKALEKYQTGKIAGVQMFAVPDDWIQDAARLIEKGAVTA